MAPVGEGVTATLETFPPGAGRGFPTVEAVGEIGLAGARMDEPAPNFRMTLADGSSLTLESLRGRPVLINHWATWCGPCQLEMPEISQAAAVHADLVVIGANMMESRETLAPFADEFAMEFPVTVDPDGILAQMYGVRGLPMTFFIDREGIVRTVWAGVLTAEKLDELLQPLL